MNNLTIFNCGAAMLASVALVGCNQVAQPTEALAHQDSAYSQTLTAIDLAKQVNMQGSQAQWLSDSDWLLASESQGLLMFNADTNRMTTLLSGNFESVSVRMLNANRYLVSSIDNNADNVVIWQLQRSEKRWQLTEQQRLAPKMAQPEAACLFFNKQTKSVSSFVADVRGHVTQTLIFDANTQQALNIPVRTFAGVSEAAGCAVSDAEQVLFVSESEVGIWRINANEESQETKKPVALAAPFGQLVPEIGALSTDNRGSLYFTSSEAQRLYRYEISDEVLHHWQLADGELALESLAVASTKAQGINALAFDDNSDSYVGFSLPMVKTQGATEQRVQIDYINASAQTEPVAAFGDAADDPAIWIHPTDASKSVILGTDKRSGLMVYNLAGDKRQSLLVGRVNNVDVRTHPSIDNATHSLVAASNRTNNSISLFAIDAQSTVVHIGDIDTNMTEIYGLCMYASSTGAYVFANDKSGLYQQYRVQQTGYEASGELVREFKLPSQPEGCSADDKRGQLFLGEEDGGIWYVDAEPSQPVNLIKLMSISEHLVDDVEGMEIYHGADSQYLVVSSQGDHSYVVYEIEQQPQHPILQRRAKFAIDANLALAIDGVSETDGLTVTSSPLPGYPKGVLVVQDGYNRMPQAPQNFKIVDWRHVESTFK